MLTCFPDPYPDEIFYSICARFSDRMQYPAKNAAIQAIFGRLCRAIADLPNHLAAFIYTLPPGHNYTISQIIDKHTLLPFYSPFLPPERLHKIRESMQEDGTGRTIRTCLGSSQRYMHSLERLRFCPQCIEEDRQQFGECYWHRTHQVSCVKFCSIHATLLRESGVRVIKRVHESDFVSAERGIQTEWVMLDVAPHHQEILQRIALDVSWLLNHPNLVCGPKLLRAQYHAHLFNRDLATHTQKVNRKALEQFFCSYYSPDLLQLLHCELDLTDPHHWLIRLLQNGRSDHHPLQHLLLMQSLGCSAEIFFSTPAEPLYFGDGPWPCLNPASDHYGENKVKNCRVTFKGPLDRPIKLFGTFACDCGFVYTREGPDRFSRGQFQITHIEAFGHTWESALRRLWDDPAVSIEQLASQLNVSQKKLMRIAEQLNLPLRPKSRKRWEIQRYASGNSTRSRYKTSNLEAYRTLWLQGMAENSEAGISELRRNLPTPFSWLRRHDMEWLNRHKPPSKQVLPIKKRPIDWDARDIQISEAVKSSAQQLKSITEYPVQVTTNALGVRTGYLHATKKCLDKLPLTAKILSEVVETREDFAIRRIWWAVDRYQEENIRPTRRQLVFRCSVQEAMAELPRVQEAVESAWRFLHSIEESESSHSQP